MPDCQTCASDADCSDGNGCTIERCAEGSCRRTTVDGCVPCAGAGDCDDRNACTDDVCSPEQVCEHRDVPSCVPCAGDQECDDADPCTKETCSQGSCRITAVAGCTPCESGDGCDDADRCTRDACADGVCTHAKIDGCQTCTAVAEVCGDHADNDCDDLVDCDDPNCDEAPRCRPAEICNDCRDNDGDGRTDYEDADCCGRVTRLDVKSLRMRADRRGRGDRLRLQSSHAVSDAFDPRMADTTLQISDRVGPMLCATVEARYWRGRRSFRFGVFGFTDRQGTFADGLEDGLFVLKRNEVDFHTSGRVPGLRYPASGDMRVTVRVGDECAHGVSRARSNRDDDWDDNRDDNRYGRRSR
jgi:hypothetical protein